MQYMQYMCIKCLHGNNVDTLNTNNIHSKLHTALYSVNIHFTYSSNIYIMFL